jgi:hypothetical protein
MNSASRAARAARNNAAWCDLICGTHGGPGEFHEHYWDHAAVVPRYYPNMVTLSEGRGAVASQMEGIERGIATAQSGQWSLKDSFNSLELGPLGLVRLFEAQWIWRPNAQGVAAAPLAKTEWSRVTSAAGLRKWEVAWRNRWSYGLSERTFHDTLVERPEVAIIVASRAGRIVGGAIANLTEDVVGLSNFFGLPGEEEAQWLGAIPAICSIFPGVPLVGYQSGHGLEHAKAAGFKTLRPLTVWALRE